MKRILIIEDNDKHAADAKAHVAKLVGCEVDYAITLTGALQLLGERKYDGAISDVFFPKDEGGPANSFENAITLNKRMVELGIHHVFNTSGNHHGPQYQEFIWKTPTAVHDENRYHFLTLGTIIESYPEDRFAEKDSKQWEAAFRYIFLALAFLDLADKGKDLIEALDIISFPYGDYGKLTENLRSKEGHPFVSEVFGRYNA